MNDFKHSIIEAKRQLPLPQLMAQLGDGDRAKPSARCPFHDDKTPSFSTFQKDGSWFWKCHSSTCGSGDEITYLEKRRGLANGEAIREFLKLAGVAARQPSRRPQAAFDWQRCVAAFAPEQAARLAKWRGLSPEFVAWLHAQGCVGSYKGSFAFPNYGTDGRVVSAHVRLQNGKWKFEPSGQHTAPLVFGDAAQASVVLAFESQWDALAIMDRLGCHLGEGMEDTAVVITRGAGNGGMVGGRLASHAACYAFLQNDAAAQQWLQGVASKAGCRVFSVATPAPHKDANDWTRAGATKADVETAIRAAQPCQPAPAQVAENTAPNFDKITADVRGEILAVLTDANCKGSARSREIAKLVVGALCQVGRLYFHAERRDFDSAMFFDGCAKRLLRIRSDAFGAWLSGWIGINRADPLFKYAFAEVETVALSGVHSTAIIPEQFWASRPGAIYLSNGDGAVAKITPQGVAMVDNGTDGVLFAAGRTLTPWKLTAPRDAFETCRLFRDAHCVASHGKDLLKLWLYSLPSNPRSKPPLCLPGTVGSGKTRTAKGFAELLGIPFVAQKVEEAKEDDFWPCCDVGGIFTLDNADTRCRWLADALANAATDGCSQRRKLYTNAETVVLRARAWLAVTTANPTFASDSGLADRLLVVRMERRDDKETGDEVLTQEILANRDAGLSHLVETLRGALADTAPTPAGLNKRHPDFAAFAVRIGRALGREQEAVSALQAAERDKSAFCLENDPIAAALLGYLREARTFHGTAAELVPHLVAVDAELEDRLGAKRLGKRLAALWPHLQGVLKSAKREHDRKGAGLFTFKTAEPAEFAEFEMPIP